MYLLLILAVALGALKNVFTKIVKKKSASFCDTMKMNVITFAIAFVVVFFMGIANLKTFFSVPWILTICYAICTLGSQIALMKAVDMGPVSISSLFYSCGFILPTLFGSFYYKEPINILHCIGILLIVVSFVFSAKKEEGKKTNFAWLIAAIGGLFFSGMVGIMQKLFTNECVFYELNNFLCMSFLFIIVISAGMFFVAKVKTGKSCEIVNAEADERTFGSIFKQYGFTVALGAVLGLVNKTNTFLSGALPSVIVFPVINGGVVILTTILSMLFFKEKLTVLQKIGLILGIIGIVCITIGKVIIEVAL
ncbi:MAG: hypothetical protein E7369_05295 [Clostridiales bacterium]|nr:hypothetical protein [Clostridiales bacterium]